MTTYRATIAVDLGEIIMHIDLTPNDNETAEECFLRMREEGGLLDEETFGESIFYGVLKTPLDEFTPTLIDYEETPE